MRVPTLQSATHSSRWKLVLSEDVLSAVCHIFRNCTGGSQPRTNYSIIDCRIPWPSLAIHLVGLVAQQPHHDTHHTHTHTYTNTASWRQQLTPQLGIDKKATFAPMVEWGVCTAGSVRPIANFGWNERRKKATLADLVLNGTKHHHLCK